MSTQRTELLNHIEKRGWKLLPVDDSLLDWWADEMWVLASTWSPVGSRVYLTFLVDPQVSDISHRKKGEDIWAVMASPARPERWQSAPSSCTLSLGHGWKEELPDFLKHLDLLRGGAA